MDYGNNNNCHMDCIYCLASRRRTKSGLEQVIKPKVMFTGVVDENGQKVGYHTSSLKSGLEPIIKYVSTLLMSVFILVSYFVILKTVYTVTFICCWLNIIKNKEDENLPSV